MASETGSGKFTPNDATTQRRKGELTANDARTQRGRELTRKGANLLHSRPLVKFAAAAFQFPDYQFTQLPNFY
jgi:hypothetical protein